MPFWNWTGCPIPAPEAAGVLFGIWQLGCGPARSFFYLSTGPLPVTFWPEFMDSKSPFVEWTKGDLLLVAQTDKLEVVV